ncbi:MAG: hypothetical protein Q9210_002485, partial [Variospora velana]
HQQLYHRLTCYRYRVLTGSPVSKYTASTMAVWNTPSYLFVIIAGSIVGFILLIGIIGIIIKYMRERKLERDLEANQAQPESNPLPQVEMVAVEPKPSNGPNEIRRNTVADPTFVNVDLSDAIGQNLSMYARIRSSMSRSRARERSRARSRVLA